MRFSLAMIKGMLDRYGIASELHQPTPVFFTKFRYYDSNHTLNKNSTIYIMEEQMEESLFSAWAKEGAVILFQKPPEWLSCNYLYISDGTSREKLSEALFRMLERFHRLENDIINCKGAPDGLDESLDILSQFLRNPIYIMDSRYKLIAINKSQDLILSSITLKRLKERGYMPINIVMELIQDENWLQVYYTHHPVLTTMPAFYCPFYNCGMYQKDHLQGFLILIELNNRFGVGDADLLEQLMPYMTQMMSSQLEEDTDRGLYYEFFIKDLVKGKLRDRLLIKEQMRPLGWKIDDSFLVLSADLSMVKEDTRELLFTRLLHFGEGKPVMNDNQLICIFHITPDMPAKSIIKECRQLFQSTNTRCGVSSPFAGIEQVSSQVMKASNALQLGMIFNPQEIIYEYNNYRMKYVFSQIEKQLDLDDIISPNLKLLQQHDEENCTEYFKTLKEYLRLERKPLAVAEALHIHRNTLLYRIGRIEELTHADLEDPEERIGLMLSYQMWDYKDGKNVE